MVEGKLRLLSQCSSAFLAALGSVVTGITTAAYTFAQNTSEYFSGASLLAQQRSGNKPGILQVKPLGTGTFAGIEFDDDEDETDAAVGYVGIEQGQRMLIVTDANGAGTAVKLEFIINGKIFQMHIDGSLEMPLIADPAAASGLIWRSSTDADVVKYSSGSTIFAIHSTKSAKANATAAAPTATAQTSSKMMAIGGAITPVNTGRVLVVISGQMANDTINDGATVDARYGTGTAPANGDAVTGTLIGIAQTQTSLVAAAKSGFCISGIISGLTLGTAYWVDLSLKAVTGGSASITGVSVSLFEL